jgi:hypothetical protein
MFSAASCLAQCGLDLALQLNQTAKRSGCASGDDGFRDHPPVEVE